MKNYLPLLLLMGLCIFACQEKRPEGKEAQIFLEHYNKTYKGQYGGDFNERYNLYAASFLKEFAAEVNQAINLDSAGVAKLAAAKQLRILSLKNSIPKDILLAKDAKRILSIWDKAKFQNFPMPYKTDRKYSINKSIEDEMLNDGKSWYMVLIEEENGELKINPYNTADFQEKRHRNILRKYSFDKLAKFVSYGSFKDPRPVNWDRIK